MSRTFSGIDKKEIQRYILNGLLATFVHYSALVFILEFVEIQSAGLANFLASFFGVIASFLGSRYFVFKGHTQTISKQAIYFVGIYLAIASLHGLVLHLWADISGLDYRIGFLIGVMIQVSFSYFGNKFLVFKK